MLCPPSERAVSIQLRGGSGEVTLDTSRLEFGKIHKDLYTEHTLHARVVPGGSEKAELSATHWILYEDGLESKPSKSE